MYPGHVPCDARNVHGPTIQCLLEGHPPALPDVCRHSSRSSPCSTANDQAPPCQSKSEEFPAFRIPRASCAQGGAQHGSSPRRSLALCCCSWRFGRSSRGTGRPGHGHHRGIMDLLVHITKLRALGSLAAAQCTRKRHCDTVAHPFMTFSCNTNIDQHRGGQSAPRRGRRSWR